MALSVFTWFSTEGESMIYVTDERGVYPVEAVSVKESHSQMQVRGRLLREAMKEEESAPDHPWIEVDRGRIGTTEYRLVEKFSPLAVITVLARRKAFVLFGRDSEASEQLYKRLRDNFLRIANAKFDVAEIPQFPLPIPEPGLRRLIRLTQP